MADNVALNFRRSRLDSVAASAQEGISPTALVNRKGSLSELNIRTEQLGRDLLETLVQLRPENFLNGAFWSGDAFLIDARDGAHLVEAHDFDFDKALRQFLPHHRIFGGRMTVAFRCMREFHQTIELPLESHLHSGAERGTLMHQRSDGDVPSVAHLAKDVFSGHANIAKEQLAEFALAGHLPQRANFAAGTLHVDQNVGESFVLGGIRI